MAEDDSSIYVLISGNLLDELLAYVLEKEVCPRVTLLKDIGGLLAEEEARRETEEKSVAVLAIDSHDPDFELALEELSARDRRPRRPIYPVLFDLEAKGTLEQAGIRRGVRGFFYRQDSLGLLLKGFRAVLRGEIWVSRQALVKSVMERASETGVGADYRKVRKAKLTGREIEILLMVSAGANNTEIADKLFISHHTVKTHLYNIFQKIGVPNRLQAALWAAHNLQSLNR